MGGLFPSAPHLHVPSTPSLEFGNIFCAEPVFYLLWLACYWAGILLCFFLLCCGISGTSTGYFLHLQSTHCLCSGPTAGSEQTCSSSVWAPRAAEPNISWVFPALPQPNNKFIKPALPNVHNREEPDTELKHQTPLALNENYTKGVQASLWLSLAARVNTAGKAIFVQMWNSMGKTDSCSNINQNVGWAGSSRQWGRFKGHGIKKKPSSGSALISPCCKSYRGTCPPPALAAFINLLAIFFN